MLSSVDSNLQKHEHGILSAVDSKLQRIMHEHNMLSSVDSMNTTCYLQQIAIYRSMLSAIDNKIR